ncbi:MAG TPA: stress-induced protein [Candidatus Binatia bacterium]|nr:stress-induced protein [Candidatus Binatia bacterium]
MAATVRAGKPGFAAMDPEKLKGIARRRGLAVQRLGKAHMFTREEAREGGKKGGHTVSRDRAHMAKIGHRGAVSPRRQRAKAKNPN